MKNWQYRGLPVEERFRTRYVVTDSGCWQWQYGKSDGYAVLRYKGKKVYGHFISYLLHKGDIPEGLEIDHLCENRACVNPNHLEAVPHRINIARGSIKRRQPYCKNGHLLEGDNLGSCSNRPRYCRACNRIRSQKHRDRRRSAIA
jgi:hypothetical protein